MFECDGRSNDEISIVPGGTVGSEAMVAPTGSTPDLEEPEATVEAAGSASIEPPMISEARPRGGAPDSAAIRASRISEALEKRFLGSRVIARARSSRRGGCRAPSGMRETGS
jgi:hypothetical protein